MKIEFKIPDGEYNLTVRRQVQNRHIEGTAEYFQYAAKLAEKNLKPSILKSGVDVGELIRKFHGKGRYDPNPKDGSPREKVDCGEVIGKYWDYMEQQYFDTRFLEIVYSKHGVHVYPVYFSSKWSD